MFLTFIAFFAIAFGCDLYIFFSFLRICPLLVKLVWWVPTVVMAVCTLLMALGQWTVVSDVFLWMLLCFTLPKLVFTALSLVGRLVALPWAPAAPWIQTGAAVVAGVVMLGAVYGLVWGWRHIVVKDVTITNPTLPAAFDGYRIAQITDLHLGTFAGDTAYIGNLVDKINALHPDLIVFTGDIMNFTPDEVEPFAPILRRLNAPDGVVSVLGNHDYSLYARDAEPGSHEKMLRRTIELERSIFSWLLLDENFAITRGADSIYVAGVQNIGRRFSANRGNLEKAMTGIPDGAYTVLLSHDPTHFDDAVAGKTRIPLTLSGHTHAMQFEIFGWSPSAWVFDKWGGLYRQGDQQMYVSTGAGGNMRFRFGAWPEIVLLTLKK